MTWLIAVAPIVIVVIFGLIALQHVAAQLTAVLP